MNKPFYLYLLILQRMSKRFYDGSIDNKIIGFPDVNLFFSHYHIKKEGTRIILKELDKIGAISIVPHRGIRILASDNTKDLIAGQLPEWYTGLMNKYEQEMSKNIAK